MKLTAELIKLFLSCHSWMQLSSAVVMSQTIIQFKTSLVSLKEHSWFLEQHLFITWVGRRCAWVASGLIIFIVFVNMSCPVLSLSFSLSFFLGGGWCELVCVCSRERGGFLFGVGWVFLLFINTWVWCHVQVCVHLHDALICISMPAWLYFFIFHSYWGSPQVCDGCFRVVFAGPCSPFASLSSCLILLGPGCCYPLLGQSQPSGVVGFKQHQYDSHCRT